MKIGVAMAFNHLVTPDFVIAAAKRIEESGFHAIWLPEHVLFFPEYGSRYPYSGDGRIPGNPEGVLDPFTALTFIAGHTSRVRLGTGICLVPQRQPVYTAKAVADLDFLSGGRVDFGVGIGWLKEEFDNLQMDFSGRGERCVEYLDVMRALWQPGITSFEGPNYQLAPCHFNPKPVQQPGPPVFFGGESAAALRRAVMHGDGWYGFNLDPGTLTERLAQLERIAAEHDREVGSVRLLVGANPRNLTPETVGEFRELGVEQLIVPLMAADMERLEARIERCQAVTGLSASAA